MLQPAASGLQKVVTDCLRRTAPGDAAVMAWPLVCGSVMAERSRALAFADGVLRVEVAHAGWKQQLQELAPRYLAILNRYVGNRVERLEFVVAGRQPELRSSIAGLKRDPHK
jgi:predicted nucleic acid-binding Zn ribbon protein